MRSEPDTVSKPFFTAITPIPLTRHTRITLNRIRCKDGPNSFQRFNGKEKPFYQGCGSLHSAIQSLTGGKTGIQNQPRKVLFHLRKMRVVRYLKMAKPLSLSSVICFLMDDVRTDFRPNLVPFATVRSSPALLLLMST